MRPTRAAAMLALSLAALAGAAAAAPQPTITFSGAVEATPVPPGGQGVLVLTGAILPHHHVYADNRFRVTPAPSEGVTYGAPATSPSKSWQDPNLPDDPPSDVWFDQVVVRVPFTVAADARTSVRVGASVKWSACDEFNCFAPETQGPIWADVPVASGAAAPPGPQPVPGPGTGPEAAPRPGPAAYDASVELVRPEVTVRVRARPGRVTVVFEPAPGHHLYGVGHPGPEHPIDVRGEAKQGIAWKAVQAPLLDATEVAEPYEVTLPYDEAGDGTGPIAVAVSWQVCLDTGTCRAPEPPHRFQIDRRGPDTTVAEAPEAGPTPVPAPPTPPAPGPGPTVSPPSPPEASPGCTLLFPVVGTREESFVVRLWRTLGILILGPLFLAGIALAFTPCVLPIIPITVSIIGGGAAQLPRGRLTFLLLCYAAGLSLAFGTLGVLASLGGVSFAAAFQSPVALWGIAGLFVLLSLGMFGVYELQPPASWQRALGGAKGGNPLGAFLLGALGAVIASPCTGPVIVGMILVSAQSGSVLLSFLMFVALGLGMGVVFFAAGSLNLLMRPGPWMVWVRYVFGVVLVGGALYYLASAEKVGPTGLFVLGFAIAAAVAVWVAVHLVRVEREEVQTAATRSAKLALLLVVATFGVALLTRRPAPPAVGSAVEEITWTNVTSREQLAAEVEKARKAGKATVVDVWATWCNYCRAYDRVIEDRGAVEAAFSRLHRLRMDLSDEDRPWEGDLRCALGVPPNTQPFMVFIDPEGRIRRDLDVEEWMEDRGAPELIRRATQVYNAP